MMVKFSSGYLMHLLFSQSPAKIAETSFANFEFFLIINKCLIKLKVKKRLSEASLILRIVKNPAS